MSAVGFPGYQQRLAAHPVAYALGLSLAIHLLFFGALELSERLHLHLPEWLKTVLNISRQLAEEKKPLSASDQEPPTLTFVEVDPSQAAAEPPQDTRNYSSFNSLAANPETTVESIQPKLDGSQNKVPKVMDTLRPAPAPPLTPMKPEPQPLSPKTEPKPEEKPGELALAKPAEKPKEEEKPARPRTLIEAQLQKGMIPGRKLKQDGGVKRHGTIASLDARLTPYAAYDEAIIRAVSKRWYDILDATTTPTRPGKVVLEFRLHYDGRVSELRVLESDVGDVLALYCQKAISDPSPYAPWPNEMRRIIGKDFRLITFTFYYEF